MIKIGGTEITDIAIGSIPIEKAYIGSQLVWEKSSLPYDAEVEYLESDGTAYIDTGFVPNQNTSVDAMFMKTSTLGNFFLFGVRPTSTEKSKEYAFLPYINQQVNFRFGNRNTSKSYLISIDTKYKLYTSKRTFYLRDEQDTNLTSSTANSNTFNSEYSIRLFGEKIGSDGGNVTSFLRIYYFKITNNTTLARDFIPVRVGTVGYLYDKVSKTLYGNANSSGAFTLGPDVT